MKDKFNNTKVRIIILLSLGIAFGVWWVLWKTTDLKCPEAIIVFPEMNYNAGEVEGRQGAFVTHAFSFTNKGNIPLVIESVKTSCSCTVTKVSKKRIAPGEKGEIVAKLTFGNMGDKSSSITIASNSITSPDVLRMYGTFLPDEVVSCYPKDIKIGCIEGEKWGHKDVEILFLRKTPETLNINVKDDIKAGCYAKITSIEKMSYRSSVGYYQTVAKISICAKNNGVKSRKGKIGVATDVPNLNTTIPVEIISAPAWSLNPDRVLFVVGHDTKDMGNYKSEIEIRNARGIDAGNMRIENGIKNTIQEKLVNKGKGVYCLELMLCKIPDKKFSGVITVAVNDGDREKRIEIPVLIKIMK